MRPDFVTFSCNTQSIPAKKRLYQNTNFLAIHSCRFNHRLLEGKLAAQPTDEVVSKNWEKAETSVKNAGLPPHPPSVRTERLSPLEERLIDISQSICYADFRGGSTGCERIHFGCRWGRHDPRFF
ncbi:MAG: hypothetical protein ACI4O0_03185 [Candidatus Limivicinus sp.]